jgi:hypothetical protein
MKFLRIGMAMKMQGAMMAAYAEHLYGHTVLQVFTKMKMVGTEPDSYVFSSVLKACSSIGALEEGLNIHQEIRLIGTRVCAFLMEQQPR